MMGRTLSMSLYHPLTVFDKITKNTENTIGTSDIYDKPRVFNKKLHNSTFRLIGMVNRASLKLNGLIVFDKITENTEN